MESSERFDVVVLGAGAAGMAAAAVASTEGLNVCLLEKAEQVGGTTAWSGGMVWAPFSKVAQNDVGFKDTTSDAKLTWHDFQLPFPIKQKSDFMRAWTAKIENNNHALINGACQILDMKILEIYQ